MVSPASILARVNTTRRHDLGVVDLAVVNVVVTVADPCAWNHITRQTTKVGGCCSADRDVACVVRIHQFATVDVASRTHRTDQATDVTCTGRGDVAVDIGVGHVGIGTSVTDQTAHVVARCCDAWAVDIPIGNRGSTHRTCHTAHIATDVACARAADRGAAHVGVVGDQVVGIAHQATHIRTWTGDRHTRHAGVVDGGSAAVIGIGYANDAACIGVVTCLGCGRDFGIGGWGK